MDNPWSLPEPGDIVWCRFPDRARDVVKRLRVAGLKPRPALVIAVTQYTDGVSVTVAYGTSQKLNRLVAGEFAIRKVENLVAYTAAGLSYDTKFRLGDVLELPWTEEFFAVPPSPRHGQTPKLGTLHPSLMKAFTSAAKSRGSR